MNHGVVGLPRVLLIDDAEEVREGIARLLHAARVDLIEADDGIRGLELARGLQPDLILLDVRMPGLDGFEVLRRLQDDPRTRAIPVIFLSSTDAASFKARGLDLGAVDYIAKGIDPEEMLARIRVALRVKSMHDQLEHRALRDALTGLGNRHALEERLIMDWGLAERAGHALAVLMADLDGFKAVNDLAGHAAGDTLLRNAAAAMRESVRAGDFIARYGGDEFVVTAHDCGPNGALAMGERMRSAVASVRAIVPAEIPVRLSVGVAVREDHDAEAASLLRRADQALYHAKAQGRDCVWGLFGGQMRRMERALRAVGAFDGGD